MTKFIAGRTICILIVLISMNILGAEYSQAQQMSGIDNSSYENNTIRILGIDPTAYPKIKVNVFVDKFFAVAGDLDKEDFRVEEDGSEVAIDNFYFTGNASGQKLDLAVVFDNTNSMRPEIGAMKSKVKDLTDSIDAAGIDAIYSLVSFGNDVSVRTAWTSDPTAFKKVVDALYVITGIDEPENPLDGIEAVLSMGFRPEAQKFILVITDDYAHHKDDGSSISNFTKEEVEADLNESGAMLVVVSPKFEGSSEYVDLREVAEDTDSLWIDIESCDFSAILEQFKGIVTGSYVIEYASPDPTPGRTKTVSVSMISPEFAEYEAISSYIVPSNVTSPNDPPVIDDLRADKESPQQPGSAITWTVDAADPNSDQILYRFFLDDEPTTNWKVESSWTWTTPSEEGEYRIEAQVRDGNHAGPNGMDDRRAASFQITSPTAVEPDNQPPVIDDLVGEQNNATAITWTATAIDEDGDQILYKFYLNNMSMTEWITNATWTLNTADAGVGENQVAVEIRDGKHSDPDDFDDVRFVQFELSSMKLMVQTWMKIFGGPGDDIAYDVQQTSDGGYIFVGHNEKSQNDGMDNANGTQLLKSDAYDTWMVKTDGSANMQWEIAPGRPLWDEGLSVQETIDNGYVIAGFTRTYGGGITDVRLIKTDSFGNIEWDEIYGGSNGDEGISVQQVSDGGYIISGYTGFSNSSSKDVWLIRVNSSGHNVWDKVFGGWNNDVAYSVKQTNDSGYIAAGWTGSYGKGAGDAWLIKTDHRGNKEWDRTFGGLNGDFAYSVQQTIEGGYIIAGYTESYGAGKKDAWLIKTDTNGNYLWDRTFGGSGDDWAYSVQQTSEGGYIIAGLTNSYGAGEEDVWLIKTDAFGNKIWDRTFGGSGIDRGWSVRQTSDGGYIVVGHTYSYGSGGMDVLLIKTDSNGNV